MTRKILTVLNFGQYNQGLRYYSFMVNLEVCNGSLKIFNDRSDNKINELKILAKHISCKYKLNLMVGNITQIKSRISINVDVSAKFCQKIMCAI